MNPTPIYTEALREAKRRTRKQSPERAALVEMDTRTDPSVRPLRDFHGGPTRLGGSSSGPVIHFGNVHEVDGESGFAAQVRAAIRRQETLR